MHRITEYFQRILRMDGTRRVTLVGVIILVLLVVLGNTLLNRTKPEVVTNTLTKTVRVQSVRELGGTSETRTLLGTVSSLREARLTTESGGRVTGVFVKLGDHVFPGTVIATIENATERAQVLQAEGVYEAALASAQASDLGSVSAERAYDEATTQAFNAYKSAFASADNVLHNTVDTVFSQPDSTIPGLRINGGSQVMELNRARTLLGKHFALWQSTVEGTNAGDAAMRLTEATAYVNELNALVVTLTGLLTDKDAYSDPVALQTFRTNFADARSTLTGVLASLSGAQSALLSAASLQEQARIAGTQGDVSLADAQVKQALGALRLAQAGLAKTIVRSPISGTIGSLNVKEGTTVTLGAPAALVTSTGGLEIVAYVTEDEARLIAVGEAARIENGVQGVITQIGSAIDPTTKKIEVRIGVRDDANALTNGQTVTVSIQTGKQTQTTTTLRLPIISIKMTPNGPVVFSVSETNTLVTHPVTLGAIIGDTVVITSGITEAESIVTDARGLQEGETVIRS